MAKSRWKPRQPNNQQEAMRLCLDYAQHRYNRSVAQVAELIGVSEWTVYKWMSEGSIPTQRLRPFEHATGATYLTQYLAATAQKLVVDIPAGQHCNEDNLLDLQNAANEAIRLLTEFYREDGDTSQVLEGINQAMKGLAGHRENVRKYDAPELGLFPGE
ncbi:MAG: helix-turn-helix transcriptional regulator [Thiohalospira sp.]